MLGVVFWFLLGAIDPSSVSALLPLVDSAVTVEKADGTTAGGTLVAVTETSVVVRLAGRQTLLEIPLADVASVTPAAVSPPATAAPAKPKAAAPVVDSGARAKAELRDANEDLERLEGLAEDKQLASLSWGAGAAVGLGICAAGGIAWAFICGSPLVLIAAGTAGLVGVIAGVMFIVEANEASAKNVAAAKQRRRILDLKEEMAF